MLGEVVLYSGARSVPQQPGEEDRRWQREGQKAPLEQALYCNLLFILEMPGPLGWGACGRGRWEIRGLSPGTIEIALLRLALLIEEPSSLESGFLCLPRS